MDFGADPGGGEQGGSEGGRITTVGAHCLDWEELETRAACMIGNWVACDDREHE